MAFKRIINMKQRPILFSTPMVQAIFEGRKTQTRRVIKPQPSKDWIATIPNGELYNRSGKQIRWISDGDDGEIKCPYGQPGDILWVRETWAIGLHSGFYYFKANGEKANGTSPWKPSIHMPKAAARIFLQIESVRVERLNDISKDDAIAEGIEPMGKGFYKDYTGIPIPLHPIVSYQSLWESINGPGSWDKNPWVWVVTFKRIEK